MSCCWLASDMGHGSEERRNWNNSWALAALFDNALLSVLCSWFHEHKSALLSEEPLFWLLWLCLEELRPGSAVCRTELLTHLKFPWESSLWLQQDPGPRQEKLAGKPHPAWLLTWTLVLAGKVERAECLGLRGVKAGTLQHELPPLLALTTLFSGLSEKVTRQNVF